MISTESRWHPVQGVRRSAAIVFSDAVGYSRMMARDEVGTLVLLNKHHHALFELVAQHGGRVVNNHGDGVLIEFALQGALGPACPRRSSGESHATRIPRRTLHPCLSRLA